MRLALHFVSICGLTAVAALATSWNWKAHAGHQPPTVLFCILVRNKAHVLPYFFGYLEELDYPKDRIAIFIRVDHSIDRSPEVVRAWTKAVDGLYHSIELSQSEESDNYYFEEEGPFDWTEERYSELIKWKEYALRKARRMWAEFIFFLDCDVFLFNQKTLQQLMAEGVVVVAPMLVSLNAYSNFWAAMDENGSNQHSDKYDAIYSREKVGCFPVPMVHSAVLMDLRMAKSLKITFLDSKHQGRQNDLQALASSVRSVHLRMYVSNRHKFGALLIPSSSSSQLEEDFENLRDLMVEALHSGPPGLLSSPFLPVGKRPADRLGFDRLFLINLKRRTDRKARMEACFEALDLDVDLVEAVDGASLSDDELRSLGIQQISEYRDPYHKRPMTTGEVGCFLSHYGIWKRMIDDRLQRVIVFEDDLRFRSHFRQWVLAVVDELSSHVPDWDFVYLGRKQLNKDDQESLVDNCTMVGQVGYSYWTLAYMLTLRGAKKLLAAEPLSRLVPVDEFLPIMFDRHPMDAWKSYFAKRDLNAYTCVPLLVYPVLYVGQEGYVSDTENTTILQSIDNQQQSVKPTSDEL
uniref:Glycosyltransferase 25 family member n=1 Tax=Trichuris muris TaxID=70415 RepID=A0A5S6QMF6_TRIMR